MKKIFFCVCAAIVCASCATQKKVETPPPPPAPAPVGRQPVESVESFLLLHPIKSDYQGTTKTYHSFYDYDKKYMHFTDQDTIAETIRTFLPEEITVQTVGYEVALGSATINPFASLTQEVRDKIKETKGVEFDNINRYQIAKSFDIKTYKDSKHAMQSLLAMLENAKMPAKSASETPDRLPITGAQGLLTAHPIKNLIVGNNGKPYYFFLDRINHYIYITDDAELYEKISTALPIGSEKENAVILQGIAIDPIILFKPETTKAMEEDQGFELNGGKGNNTTINNYTLATIENYGIVRDYKSVIAAIRVKIGTAVAAPTISQRKTSVPPPVVEKKTSAPVSTGNGRRPGH